jgi:hypothetical protein
MPPGIRVGAEVVGIRRLAGSTEAHLGIAVASIPGLLVLPGPSIGLGTSAGRTGRHRVVPRRPL